MVSCKISLLESGIAIPERELICTVGDILSFSEAP